MTAGPADTCEEAADRPPVPLPELVRAAFGDDRVTAVTRLPGGRYNDVFRVDLAASGPVVLRLAPEPARQYRFERTLMRNEVAAAALLAPIAALMPETLTADFSHRLIGRDYLFQRFLPGVSASTALPGFADTDPFWEGLGAILASLHAVSGPGFGRIQGPIFPTWHESLAATFADMVQDLHDAGLPFNDLRTAAALLEREGGRLDGGAFGRGSGGASAGGGSSGPRLLHGDLWIGNLLLEPDATVPRIVGVLDSDRVTWGDPAADWTFHLLRRRTSAEKAAFWRGYGARPATEDAPGGRAFFHRVRNLVEARLEYHRLGLAERAAATYPRLERELDSFFAAR